MLLGEEQGMPMKHTDLYLELVGLSCSSLTVTFQCSQNCDPKSLSLTLLLPLIESIVLTFT